MLCETSRVIGLAATAGCVMSAAAQVTWSPLDMQQATAVTDDGTVYGTTLVGGTSLVLARSAAGVVTPVSIQGFELESVEACSADGSVLLALARSGSQKIVIKHFTNGGGTATLGAPADSYHTLSLSDDGQIAAAVRINAGTCISGVWWTPQGQGSLDGNCGGPFATFVQYARVARASTSVVFRTDTFDAINSTNLSMVSRLNTVSGVFSATCLGARHVDMPFLNPNGSALTAIDQATGAAIVCGDAGLGPAPMGLRDASAQEQVLLGYLPGDPYLITTPELPQLSIQSYLQQAGASTTGWAGFTAEEVSSNGRYVIGSARNLEAGQVQAILIDRGTTVVPQFCDSIDFNNNGVFPEDQDVVDFFGVLAGGECAGCNDIDFNNNGVFPEDQDVVDFFDVLAGGDCPG